MPVGLFQPDRFSNSEPEYVPVSKAVFGDLYQSIEQYFTSLIGLPNVIQSVGAIELNSRNFKITTDKGSYLLKLVPTTKVRSEALAIAKLQIWSRGQGFPVEPPIYSQKDSIFMLPRFESDWLDGPHRGSLFRFIEGSYFSGDAKSIVPVADLIGRFFKSLKASPFAEADFSRRYYLTQDDHRVFSHVVKNQDVSTTWFSAQISELLKEYWATIEPLWSVLSEKKQRVFESPQQLVHMDLHPHNLLFTGTSPVAIIDFDSIAVAPLGIAYAFAAYKLLRQCVVKEKLCEKNEIKDLAARFNNAFVDAFPESESQVNNVAIFAKAEILRRLIIVFRLNLDHRDATWNSVVPMHIAALKEIEILFE
jgi:Ser/Thr protein kinase RdoA (MazF antagonist)